MNYDQMSIDELLTEKDKLSDEINELCDEIKWNKKLMQDKYISYMDKKELENEIVYFRLQISKLETTIKLIDDNMSNRVIRKLSFK